MARRAGREGEGKKQKRALSRLRDEARLPMFGIIKRGVLHSAEGGNRTLISVRIHDFESCASASSATSAKRR